MKQWVIYLLSLAVHFANSTKSYVDLFDECEEWAKRGDCSGENNCCGDSPVMYY